MFSARILVNAVKYIDVFTNEYFHLQLFSSQYASNKLLSSLLSR